MFDNVQYFRGEPRSISDIEEAICRSADIVFATAHSLVEKAKKLNERVVYLPNGADTEKFDIPEMDSHPLDMFPHPRLIYIGAISDWFDFKLLAQAASQRPDWSFVLVGPLTAEAQSETALLNSLPNIHLMGWCDPKQVPAYLNHADVGLIPFRINSLTHSVSPIKLYEYCAAGLPVVAPRLHEIVESKLPSYFYVDLQGFIRAIEEGLRNRDRLRPKLLEFGRKNSWDMRYETVCENLTTL
jgi:glycosyltransferase involved in cell wall biosynthesis